MPAARRRARWVVPAACAVLLTLVAACTPASPSPSTYRERTKLAVTDTISHVETARIVLEASRTQRITGPYALSTVRASEETLSKVTGSYAELYPPRELDRLFVRTSSLLGDASDLLTESRIALKRDERSRYPSLVADLDRLGKQLEDLEKRLS